MQGCKIQKAAGAFHSVKFAVSQYHSISTNLFLAGARLESIIGIHF